MQLFVKTEDGWMEVKSKSKVEIVPIPKRKGVDYTKTMSGINGGGEENAQDAFNQIMGID